MRISSKLMMVAAAGALMATSACTTDPVTGQKRISKAALGGIGHALCRDDPFRRIIAAHMLSWIGIQSLFIYLVPVIQQRMPGLDHAALGRVTALAYLALNGVAALAPVLVLAPLTARFR